MRPRKLSLGQQPRVRRLLMWHALLNAQVRRTALTKTLPPQQVVLAQVLVLALALVLVLVPALVPICLRRQVVTLVTRHRRLMPSASRLPCVWGPLVVPQVAHLGRH